MLDADFNAVEVDCPIGNWCDSGHRAPELFGRNGPDTDPLPMRFFMVNGKALKGTYCELCLMIANKLAQNKKQGLIK